MPVKIRKSEAQSQGSGEFATELVDPIAVDVYHDGQKFTLGPNQKMVHGDDGVGIGLAASHGDVAENAVTAEADARH